jgi:hypothetical protein
MSARKISRDLCFCGDWSSIFSFIKFKLQANDGFTGGTGLPQTICKLEPIYAFCTAYPRGD